MKDLLKVALIQTDIFWENPEANRASLEEKICQIAQKIDLIILPEMFTTGFSVENSPITEPPNHTTTKWMKQIAQRISSAICGTIPINENGHVYNRFLFVIPDGTVQSYDKKHLFRIGTESRFFSEGKSRVNIEYKGWKICPQICYDLRFPVWSINKNLQYDLLIYVASWPDARLNAWDTLLKARAIENQSYVLGVNRIGKDGAGLSYSGHSTGVDPLGVNINPLSEKDDIIVLEIDKNKLNTFREKYPFYKDGDNFEIIA